MEAPQKPPQLRGDRRVHLANERTFLAWIRTSISIMAFGFVVERFSLFVHQIAVYLGRPPAPSAKGFAAVIGILLVALGMAAAALGFVRYRSTERQIDEDVYRPAQPLNVLLTVALLVIGLFLLVYLVHGLSTMPS